MAPDPLDKILILALGSWEQHGAHLPFDTDTVIIDAVVSQSLQQLDQHSEMFTVAPTIPISASDEHGGFSGTLSTGTQALADSLVAISRSSSWTRGICIVNGHGGNADALRLVHEALNFEKIRHSIWSLPNYDGADMHAGHTETSLMLHINSEAVQMHVATPGATGDSRELIAQMRIGGVQSVTTNGILGDPTTATEEDGRNILQLYVSSLTTHLMQIHSSWT